MRKLLLFILPLLVFTNLHGQSKFKSSTYIGIHTGADFCRVAFTPHIPQGVLTSTSNGFIFRHISEPHLGLQLEVNYSGKGWIEKQDTLGTYKRRLLEINVPLQSIIIIGSKKLQFVFTVGPYLSYLVNDNETVDIKGPKWIYSPVNFEYRSYYGKSFASKWEFGFTGGLSVELHTGFGIFCVQGSYSNSLTNLYPLNVPEFYYQGSRPQVLNLGLVYMIKI